MSIRTLAAFAGLALLELAAPDRARAERVLAARVDELTLDAALPGWATNARSPWSDFGGSTHLLPRVELDGGGEAYLDSIAADPAREWERALYLVLRTELEGPVSGTLWLPDDDWRALRALRFEIATQKEAAPEQFFRAMEHHYDHLLDLGVPGAAWFRYRREVARSAQAAGSERGVPEAALREAGRAAPVAERRSEGLDDTLDLFSGSRALAENLQLDRILQPREGEGASIALSSLEGITVREYDWKAHLGSDPVALDPLASLLPADQHAILFPTFPALLEVMDELERTATPLAELVQGRALDVATRRRYERQLALPLSEIARKLGPLFIDAVAVTGSDPHLAGGSDLALLFQTEHPEALLAYLAAAYARAKGEREDAVVESGESAGAAWQCVRTADRAVSSYAARIGEAVVVANSRVQIEAIAGVAAGARPALAGLDEYRFFRTRYPRGTAAEPGESAFAILTDATIRRWCGPRWRIGESRRIRAAAALAHERAHRAAVEAKVSTLAVVEDRVLHAVYNGLDFLTPISELDFDQVTPEEAAAYARFRNTYQERWRNVFDPIAVRLTAKEGRIETDVSVMPLIGGSEFRELMEIAGSASIDSGDGDPHAEAMLHAILAFDKDASPLVEARDFFEGMLGDLKFHPLAWVGDHVEFYVDESPIWDELPGEDDDRFDFLEANLHRLPVAVSIAVADPLREALFITALRAFAEQSVPGMLRFEAKKVGEISYVKVHVEGRMLGDETVEPAFYYAATAQRLILTPHEELIQRALTRHAAARDAAPPREPWLGKSAAIALRGHAIAALEAMFGGDHELERQRISWGNLPILDEWHRLFPAEDPVAVHERVFGQRLVCPGGGTYAYDAGTRCCESSAYGSPARPKAAPTAPSLFQLVKELRAGVTFEDDGLRAVLAVER